MTPAECNTFKLGNQFITWHEVVLFSLASAQELCEAEGMTGKLRQNLCVSFPKGQSPCW